MGIFRKGDAARVTCGGRTLEAEIVLASANGRSLYVSFEGALGEPGRGMCVGGMPLLAVGQDGDEPGHRFENPVTGWRVEVKSP
jgi:hypothetical protein